MAPKRSRKTQNDQRSRKKIAKQQEESDNEETKVVDTFSTISMDLKMDILMRLDDKSIAKFNFVSNHWSSTVRGKEFMDFYMKRSLARPRLLFILSDRLDQDHFVHTCSQDDPSSDNLTVNIDRNIDRNTYFLPPIRGLICSFTLKPTLISVGNPTTHQFVTLPNPHFKRKGAVCFFGHDPVDDIYKVLALTVRDCYFTRGSSVVGEEHKVYTLGAKEPWREVKCTRPHLPLSPVDETRSLCLNGVIYYFAWIKKDGALITFGLKSERFGVITLPKDVREAKDFRNLVNYGGKVAITDGSPGGKLDLRVLDATKKRWTKVSIEVPSWKGLVGNSNFYFKGAISTGQLVFAPKCARGFYFVSYDLKKNKAKKVAVEAIGDKVMYADVFFDHFDCPLVLL